MDWNKLVSSRRLGREQDAGRPDARSEFLKDWDRIVYSSAFRRMQDKTQVFPLSDSDYVRTRLTHSIEVSSVGRSLGMLCGEFILQQPGAPDILPQDFGSIVAASCLAHDLGNPPFGHSGEDAIQSWFRDGGARYLDGLSQAEQADLRDFEGNAQGFRLITRLQNALDRGGFQLTYAVLSTFLKYPRGSVLADANGRLISEKKFNFFQHDAPTFERVASETGLIRKSNGSCARHPLAFLMEAADDICYGVVDLEDGHRVGRVSFREVEALLMPIAFDGAGSTSESYTQVHDNTGRVEYLRARAIGVLIHAVVEAFKTHYAALMAGTFESSLVDRCAFAPQLRAIAELSRAQIYSTPAVLQIEAAGFEILGGLLAKFVPALVQEPALRSSAHRKIVQIVPAQFAAGATRYQRLLGATDYVSGMTDSFALTLFRRLNGIEMPGSGF
ncbi:deoxyguanosinetriphosphate triphosphohydrolase [Massilia sp. PAMC28688]|uniref:deoxyguanosinetriphosphate triphosphohydrolase n=1 Tax=Massilia sp. PAMC28688 TaxID=2861283 RepID=UPI001C62BC21|nr:deoxyguanosinetriphosphate triphosphohydrolase [Massilia sp. PAMC28688]QYF94110.1 deoxyguanosinetriphosphate triphosphohydrolase [Massilia sp. PAMC28688]